MTAPRIKPQVVFGITAPMFAESWLKGEHGFQMRAGIAAALLCVFGLPVGTPVQLRGKGGAGWSLVEVQGKTVAHPSEAEIQAALLAAVACSAMILYGNTYAELSLPAASEPGPAPERLN